MPAAYRVVVCQYMQYLITRTKNQLLLLIVIIPVIGNIAFRLLNIQYVHWLSVSALIALVWQLGTIFKLNKQLNNEFDLTITKIAGIAWLALLFISIFRLFLAGFAESALELNSFLFIIPGMIVNLFYFYIIYILTRIHTRATTKHDPSGIELFPKYFYFLIYPIAIWKYQNELRKEEPGTQHMLP